MAEDHLELTMAPGEEYVVTLPSLGTAGFRWDVVIDGTDGVVDATHRRSRSPEGPSVGRSAPEQVVLTARTPGEAVVRLTQSRPWESDRPPRLTRVMTVHVDNVLWRT